MEAFLAVKRAAIEVAKTTAIIRLQIAATKIIKILEISAKVVKKD
jgi:hypothetical protein